MQPFLADLLTTGIADLHFGHVLRSPIPRGRVRGLRLPPLPEGCYLVRGRDIPGKRTLSCGGFSHPVLGDPRVQYQGQPYALLAGPDRDVLAELAGAARVDWEELPADEPGDSKSGSAAPAVQYRRGDPDAAFRDAFQMVEAEYQTERRRIHDPDLAGALVQVSDKSLTVYASTQDPFGLREAVAGVLKLPSRRVSVVATRLANPMEGKFLLSVLVAAHAAVLATICRKPVWLSEEPVDNHRYGFPGPGFRIRQQTALDREGGVVGARIEMELLAGAYPPAAESVLLPAVRASWGGYRVPNLEIKAATACSNRVPTGSFRAAGRAQAFFAAELNSSRLEEISEQDPYTWKARNLVRGERSAEPRPAGSPKAVLEAVAEMADFRRKHASFASLKKRRQSALGPPHPLRGIGLAVAYQERHDPGVFSTRPHRCAVRAVLDTDKRLHLYTSLVDHGPGIHALFVDRAARLLELDPAKVIVADVDTQVVPDTGPSTLSRALSVGLPLVEQCCQAIRMKRIKGLLPIEVRRSCRSPGPAAPEADGVALPVAAESAWGAAVVEVEVDPESLEIAMRGIWMALLCGRLDGLGDAEAYVVGEVIRAAGWACLAEHAPTAGESAAPGVPEAPAWAAGSLPRLSRVPPVLVRFVEDPNPAPRGFEQLAHLSVPPAYAAAVSQATGLYVDRIPITPEVLQECLET